MASHKNQHFVPRCYLKPFTVDGLGRAIHVCNLDRLRLIEKAPVKSQCSSSYFYGEDLLIERDLQQIEGAYATVLPVLLHGRPALAEQIKDFLRAFWLLQFTRTEAASRRMAEMTNGFTEHAGAPDAYRISVRQAVELAMRQLAELLPSIADLKVCLLRNRTALPLITSDDPAIQTNRWYLSDERTRGRSLGLGKAGALLLLPLSPSVICVFYDGDVYSIPHTHGWASIDRPEDVRAFNEHQFLNCGANIYYQDWPGRAYLLEEVARLKGARPQQRYRITLSVFDREENGYNRYRVVDRWPEDAECNAMIHSESIAPVPSAWPSVIGWRSGAVAFTNGTAIGYVRRSEAEARALRGCRKVRLR